jgi:hypothetical protein
MEINSKEIIANLKKEFELKKKLKQISKPILIRTINKERDKKKRINLSELSKDNYLNSKRYFYKELKY